MEYVPGKSFSEWGVAACVTNVFESCVSLSLSRRKPHTRLTLICKNDSDHARLTHIFTNECESHARLTHISFTVAQKFMWKMCMSLLWVFYFRPKLRVGLVWVLNFRGKRPTQDSHTFVLSVCVLAMYSNWCWHKYGIPETRSRWIVRALCVKNVFESCVSFSRSPKIVWKMCESRLWVFHFRQKLCVKNVCGSFVSLSLSRWKTHTRLTHIYFSTRLTHVLKELYWMRVCSVVLTWKKDAIFHQGHALPLMTLSKELWMSTEIPVFFGEMPSFINSLGIR